MENNLQYWDKVKQPPSTAIKPIKAGRLKGMSDISPQWRYFALTEMFGPVGIGWKYTIDKQWLESGSYDQSCAFTNISLYVKHDGDWSDAIPGTGGSDFIAKETKTNWDTKEKFDFLYTSDEAFKMSLTDALSVAMKTLGVAANIYSGNQDYSKYTKPVEGNQDRPQNVKPEGKGFYNDFHKHKSTMLAKLDSGEYANPQAIIDKLSTDFKISGKDRAAILALTV